ncbi:MAG: 4-hydroxy-tetrahydrodipicolinate reductase [Bacteroidetes bacterium]|nr:MAG: 4-hydroxy-tetrahydrodipicolinate reductase [Bacteroidota bacterium]
MKIAIIGYGKMGTEIEKIAIERNHEIVLKINDKNLSDFSTENLKNADVAIDFSTPKSAYGNILKCFESGVSVVAGTTGWLQNYDNAVAECKKQKLAFFYASNFSLGVNIFFEINKHLAKIMNKYSDYDITIEEAHHIHKIDAPSGTAITLANDIIKNIDRKKAWNKTNKDKNEIQISSVREGNIPGTHTIIYDSYVDKLEIKHIAKNRQGFALGAVLAAEFIQNKNGIFDMNDLLNL